MAPVVAEPVTAVLKKSPKWTPTYGAQTFFTTS
jgi:hypothetical protein